MDNEWDKLRRQCYARDNYTCRLCGVEGAMVHAHHIVLKSKGGKDELDNLETLCGTCHALKHGWIAATVWLFAICVQQLGVPFMGFREENFFLDAEVLEGLRFRFHKQVVDIQGLKATVLLPVARLDESNNIINRLPEGFLERAISLWQEMCVERLEE